MQKHPITLQHKLADGLPTPTCSICERHCPLYPGEFGACGLYSWTNNHIVERFPDSYLVVCPISIETMPTLHFHPGGKFLQITTTGCNFDCSGCISTMLVQELPPTSRALKHFSTEQIIAMAKEQECQGIIFMMNDPLAAFPRFLRLAQQGKAHGLLIGCSSNAYFTEESLAQLMPFLDFINIGIKGFSDTAYRNCGAKGISPVLRNLATMHHQGIHIEISCILKRNNQEELLELARHIRSLSSEIPLQVMRFLPFESAAPASEPSIREAESFCQKLKGILDYVYLFNSPGSTLLDTTCPKCGKLILHREFFGPMGAKLRPMTASHSQNSDCPSCGHHLPITGPSLPENYLEGSFEGGYPLTRAMEIVEGMLIAMGVREKRPVVKAWEYLLADGGLNHLHRIIQHPRAFVHGLRDLGHFAGIDAAAEELASSMERHLDTLESSLPATTVKPRVYYTMGKPLFCLNGERLENTLVEMAGGISINKDMASGGRPGRNITPEQLIEANPEFIFISAFLGNNRDDFIDECLELGLSSVDAVKNQRIYVYPAPGWDFGSPRWILGLMYIATILHPSSYHFDIMAEAKSFYNRFYEIPFIPERINRSFAKPSVDWQWDLQDQPLTQIPSREKMQ